MKLIRAAFLGLILSACSDSIMSPPPQPPPAPEAIAVAYCTGLEPLWVAFQDGDGPWTQVRPVASGGTTEFQFTFSASRGAIATVTAGGAGTTFLNVLYGTPAQLETAGDTSPRYCGPPVVKSLLGSVAGLDDNEFAIIRGGFVSEAVVPPVIGSDFVLDVLPPGPRDILATRGTRTNGSNVLTKIILRRGIDLPDGATLPVLDFGSAEAFAPAVANVLLEGLDGAGAFVSTRLRTSNFESPVSFPFTQSSEATRPYVALPEARLLPGDLQVLTASTHGARPNSVQSAIVYFRTPTDRALALGAEIIPPTFSTVARAPSLRLRAHFTAQSEYDREASISYLQDPTANVAVSMTAAYAALSGMGYDLTVPELSGVPGFNPAWELRSTETLRWSAVRIGGTLGLGIDPVPNDGAVQRRAFATDVIAP